MSKTDLKETGGFTPAIDGLVIHYGPITALVFGRIWRYCQMKNGVCTAAVEKIAMDLKISPKTISRRIKILEDDGFIEDLTPNLRNRPHVYQDTGKAEWFDPSLQTQVVENNSDFSDSFEEVTKSESPSSRSVSPTTRTQLPSQSDTESIEDTTKKALIKDEIRKEETEEDFLVRLNRLPKGMSLFHNSYLPPIEPLKPQSTNENTKIDKIKNP